MKFVLLEEKNLLSWFFFFKLTGGNDIIIAARRYKSPPGKWKQHPITGSVKMLFILYVDVPSTIYTIIKAKLQLYLNQVKIIDGWIDWWCKLCVNINIYDHCCTTYFSVTPCNNVTFPHCLTAWAATKVNLSLGICKTFQLSLINL